MTSSQYQSTPWYRACTGTSWYSSVNIAEYRSTDEYKTQYRYRTEHPSTGVALCALRTVLAEGRKYWVRSTARREGENYRCDARLRWPCAEVSA